MRFSGRSGVPAATFLLAVVLSWSAGAQPPRPGRPQAAPTQDCDCNVKIDNLKGVVQAKNWKPSTPGAGTLEIRGMFDTHVNTEKRHIGEFVYLTMKISVKDLVSGQTVTGTVMGKVKKSERTLDGSPTCFKVVDDKVKIGQDGKNITLNDGSDISDAIVDGAALIDASPVDPKDPASNGPDIRVALEQLIEVLYEVQMGGFTKEKPTVPCPSRIYGVARIDFKKNQTATERLHEVRKPQGTPPF